MVMWHKAYNAKKITNIQKDLNRLAIAALDIFIVHDGLIVIMVDDVFATHGNNTSAVII